MERKEIDWTLCLMCEKVNADKALSSSEGLQTMVANITKIKAINGLPNEMLKLFSVGADLLSTLRNNSAIITYVEINTAQVCTSEQKMNFRKANSYDLNLEVFGLVHQREILTAYFGQNMTLKLTYSRRVHTMHRKRR